MFYLFGNLMPRYLVPSSVCNHYKMTENHWIGIEMVYFCFHGNLFYLLLPIEIIHAVVRSQLFMQCYPHYYCTYYVALLYLYRKGFRKIYIEIYLNSRAFIIVCYQTQQNKLQSSSFSSIHPYMAIIHVA